MISGLSNIDPDFGWHVRIGEIMLKSGVPKSDPFSYTMPSFPWVDHGRLSDVLVSWLLPKIGLTGLAIMFALVVLSALWAAIPFKKLIFGVVPLLLGLGVIVTRAGIRPQVEDWLFFSILVRLVYEDKWWEKWKWGVPILFMFWANLHGGFTVGLMVLLIRVWGAKKIDWGVWLLSILATGLNPYGFRLWWEIWLTVSDAGLRTTIVEWQPFYAKAELGIWLFTALLMALVKLFAGQIDRKKMVLAGLFLLAGMSSLRNMPFYFLAGLPLVTEMMEILYKTVNKEKIMWGRAKRFYVILIGICLILFGVEVIVPTIKSMRNKSILYPDKAVEYLNNNPIGGGQLFSDYGWGGYLIWKLPGQKVFVDGRMPSWRFKAPVGESDNAFADYKKIVAQGKYRDLFAKYNIRTVLWAKGGSILAKEKPFFDVNNIGWLNNWFEQIKKQNDKDFISELIGDGWRVIYEDEVAVIYASPTSTN